MQIHEENSENLQFSFIKVRFFIRLCLTVIVFVYMMSYYYHSSSLPKAMDKWSNVVLSVVAYKCSLVYIPGLLLTHTKKVRRKSNAPILYNVYKVLDFICTLYQLTHSPNATNIQVVVENHNVGVLILLQ